MIQLFVVIERLSFIRTLKYLGIEDEYILIYDILFECKMLYPLYLHWTEEPSGQDGFSLSVLLILDGYNDVIFLARLNSMIMLFRCGFEDIIMRHHCNLYGRQRVNFFSCRGQIDPSLLFYNFNLINTVRVIILLLVNISCESMLSLVTANLFEQKQVSSTIYMLSIFKFLLICQVPYVSSNGTLFTGLVANGTAQNLGLLNMVANCGCCVMWH